MIHTRQVPISQLTSFQGEGYVSDVFVFDDAAEMAHYVAMHDACLILGKGSNTVFEPSDALSPIIQLSSQYKTPHFVGDTVHVGAGVGVNQLMSFSKETGFSGFEFMAGVPASVGGMIAMNFGCWGKEIVDMLVSVDVVLPDGTLVKKDVAELEFGYRFSSFQIEPWIVVSACFYGALKSPEEVKKDIFDNVNERVNSQPLRDKTFGSVFRNPPGLHAAQLLEDAGFKGYKKGRVMFSDQHANFMVNLGGATYSEVVALIQEARAAIVQSKGVHLMTEVVLVTL